MCISQKGGVKQCEALLRDFARATTESIAVDEPV